MATLITGGTGFIGSYIVARLLVEEGEQPVLFDIAPPRGMLSDLGREIPLSARISVQPFRLIL